MLLAFDPEQEASTKKQGEVWGELLIVPKAKFHSLHLNLLGGNLLISTLDKN